MISDERLKRIVDAHPSRDWWHFDMVEAQEIARELLAARARIAELEAAEKRDVADELQTEADWKQERERMEGEIQRMRTAADQAVKLIDRACIVSRHKAIMERLMAASETLRAALGKTV